MVGILDFNFEFELQCMQSMHNSIYNLQLNIYIFRINMVGDIKKNNLVVLGNNKSNFVDNNNGNLFLYSL